MKQVFLVTGMTCEGCKAKVEHLLHSVTNVTEVAVKLEDGTVEVISDHPISATSLQEVLPAKYQLSLHLQDHEATKIEQEENYHQASKLRQLRPLFLILFYISIAAILLNLEDRSLSSGMLDFMGLFFIVFSFFKLLDLKGFKHSFAMYDPLAKIIPSYGWLYPFIETALGLFFLMRFEINTALVITLIVLGITTIGVTSTLMNKRKIQCACLGTALKLPMTEATFIENAIMIVMALLMLFGIFNF